MKTFSADYCRSLNLLSEKETLLIGAKKDLEMVVWKSLLAIIFCMSYERYYKQKKIKIRNLKKLLSNFVFNSFKECMTKLINEIENIFYKFKHKFDSKSKFLNKKWSKYTKT